MPVVGLGEIELRIADRVMLPMQRRPRVHGSLALTKFTVWVRDGARASTHVDVYDATDVAEAIQQALEKVSQEWRSVPDRLTVLGVAEGDVRMKGE